MKAMVSSPAGKKAKKLTKEDVWGKWDEDSLTKLSNGMIVARASSKCPVFKDIVPFKSVTVTCDIDLEQEVIYWLEYVHGANSVSGRKILKGNKIALRSDYRCW